MADTFRIYKKDGTKIAEGPSPLEFKGLNPDTAVAEGDFYATQKLEDNTDSPKTNLPAFRTLPDTPASPTVTAKGGDGVIDVTVMAPKVTTGITGYNVYMKTTSANWDAKPALQMTSDKLTGQLTGLTNGTEYTVAATAVSSGGESSKDAEGASTHATPVKAS